MRIESLNVWGAEIYDALESHLLKNSRLNDVYLFQEADKRFPELARRVLGGNYCIYEAFKKVDETDFFPQMICVRSGIKALGVEPILMDIPNVGLALNCQIQTRNGVVNVCNVHGISQPGNKLDTDKRLEQSRGMIDFFQSRNEKTIIGGDFNVLPATESIEMFEKNGYVDLIKKFGIKTTRNEFAWKNYPDNKFYFSDYAFVSSDVKVKSFTVPDVTISDHLPMVLEIE
jgi:endonuclease/exonuclease/phosphatase family metal-dependent hydrolase